MAGKSVINDRARKLLKLLVERYIREGQPIGSRTLAKDVELDLSPATIRNVMSDLEELGLLHSPHTSAGRVPTVEGYRLFVDSLLTVKPLDIMVVERLKSELDQDADTSALLESASSLLSGITNMAGVVTLPRREKLILRQVDFLSLSPRRVLVILVINEHEVQNRVIHTDRDYSAAELQRASNYLNQKFSGYELMGIREDVLCDMQQIREDMNETMIAAIEMASRVFEEDAQSDANDYVLAGQNNLMDFAEISSVEKLRKLFEAFNTKQDILHLLDQSIHTTGVQIFIGHESGYGALESCSVVTAPYTVEGQMVGVLGVIGPTRMAYDRVIPIVDVTAKLLGSALTLE